MQQWKNRWESFFLWVLCRGYMYNADQLPLTNSHEMAVRRGGDGYRPKDASPGAEDRLLLEDITKQHSEDWLRTPGFVW
jgi:hypothetical protein